MMKLSVRRTTSSWSRVWILLFIFGVISIPIFQHSSVRAAQTSRLFTHAVAWSPDGSLIAFNTGTDGCNSRQHFTVSLMSVATGQIVRSLEAGFCPVRDLDFNASGTQLVAAVGDWQGFFVWEVSTGSLLPLAPLGGQGLIAVSWRPNYNQIAVVDISNGVGILDAATGNILQSPQVGAAQIAWNPDGGQLATTTHMSEDIKIVDGNSGQVIQIIETDFPQDRVTWSPDGSKIVTTENAETIKVWNVVTGQLLSSYTIADVFDLTWSPNSQQIALAVYTGSVQILDIAQGQIVETLSSRPFTVDVDWSPDGAQVVYGSEVFEGDPPIQIQLVIPAVPTPALMPDVRLYFSGSRLHMYNDFER